MSATPLARLFAYLKAEEARKDADGDPLRPLNEAYWELDTASVKAHAELLSLSSAEVQAEIDRQAGDIDRPLLLTWMAGIDSGASSASLARYHLGLPPGFGWMEPADSGDFGRCYRLLLRFPKIRPCVDELARKHKGWAKLALIWDELTQMALEDGLDQRGNHSDRISARIRAVRWPAHPAFAGSFDDTGAI